jgi:hypothetical protein
MADALAILRSRAHFGGEGEPAGSSQARAVFRRRADAAESIEDLPDG